MMGPEQRTAVLEAVIGRLGEERGGELWLEGFELGVARVEIEAEFGSDEELLFAAYDHLAEEVVAIARNASRVEGSWPEQVRCGLAALLQAIAARPALALVAVRSFPSRSPEAYRHYVALVSRFEALLRGGRAYAAADGELPGAVELLAAGSAESIVFEEIEAGRAEALLGKLPEVLFSLLVPFLGPERAAEEMRAAS